MVRISSLSDMSKPSLKIKELYPTLSEAELAQAEDNLERYLALVLRIFERIEAETYPQPTLTDDIGTLPCTPPPAEPSA